MGYLLRPRFNRSVLGKRLNHIRFYSLGRLQNRVAIVTGSSSGLGRAIALRYAAEGARVVCADLRPGVTQDGSGDAPTHELITERGGASIFIHTDVSEEKSIKALIETATLEFERLDMYVEAKKQTKIFNIPSNEPFS
jgi:NADP-dependent 3-hydroxy acid dehydrogenase YdfG